MVDPLETSTAELLASLGFELVEFHKVGSPERPILQIRIDLPGTVPGKTVSSDDCVRASRALERDLEERGLVGPQYTLEVSSPGFDRLLRNAADWRRFTGERVKFKHQAVQGATYGFIDGVHEISANRIEITIRPEGVDDTMILDLASMREARLAPDMSPKPKPGKTAREPVGKTASGQVGKKKK
ncbi:MAG: hypothetical protein ABIQ41_06890 [Gemmatimonadales bacterium]